MSILFRFFSAWLQLSLFDYCKARKNVNGIITAIKYYFNLLL